MKNIVFALFTSLVVFASCAGKNNRKVEISTPYGTMIVRLYDDTPHHRDNFLRLAESGQYDSLLFHRVIEGFMIQGGDPESRYATHDTKLGSNEIGEKIEAEITFPQHYHKRGALAAARQADNANPERLSSGSQFYIVQGCVYPSSTLDEIEQINNKTLKNKIFYEIQPFYVDSLKYYQEQGMFVELSELQLRVMMRVEELANERGLFSFPDSIRNAYTTTGGAPSLDGNYTVFGELIEGFAVLDSIAAQEVRVPGNRPVKDIRMSMRVIE